PLLSPSLDTSLTSPPHAAPYALSLHDALPICAFTLGVSDHLMAFKNGESKQEAITKFFDYYFRAENYVPWVEAENFLPTTISGSDRKSTRLNSSHVSISYAVFCLKKTTKSREP